MGNLMGGPVRIMVVTRVSTGNRAEENRADEALHGSKRRGVRVGCRHENLPCNSEYCKLKITYTSRETVRNIPLTPGTSPYCYRVRAVSPGSLAILPMRWRT